MYCIRFVNQATTLEVEGGLLSDACAKAGFPLNLVCGGKGTCGKCAVEVEKDGARETVLACHTQVTSDLNVYLRPEHISRKASILTGGVTGHSVRLSPAVQRRCFTREQSRPSHCGA